MRQIPRFLAFVLSISIVTGGPPAGAQNSAKKRIFPRLDAEITELGNQAVLSNINFQTTPSAQKSARKLMILGVGFFVVDSPLMTQPAARSVCKQFGYADAESADWETDAVGDSDLLYLADPMSLQLKVTYGKDLPKEPRRIKHLASVICRT